MRTIERLFSGNALRPELDDLKWPQLTFFPRQIATVTNGSITDLEDKFEHEILPTFDWLLRAKKFANTRQVKNMVAKRTRCTEDEMDTLADEEKENWDWRWCREETCDPGMRAWSHGRNVLDEEKGPAHVSTMLLVALPPWEWTPERLMSLGENRKLKVRIVAPLLDSILILNLITLQVVSDEDKAKDKVEDNDDDDDDEDLDKLHQVRYPPPTFSTFRCLTRCSDRAPCPTDRRALFCHYHRQRLPFRNVRHAYRYRETLRRHSRLHPHEVYGARLLCRVQPQVRCEIPMGINQGSLSINNSSSVN